MSLAPLAKTQVHKVLCSFQDFYSNKRLVDSQKTKIIAQFTEKHTHTHTERKWKNPPFFSRTIHKSFQSSKEKNRLWFPCQVVNPNKQKSSQVRSWCLWKCPYVLSISLFVRDIWTVHNISWLFTCTVQSTVRLCTLCTERCFTVDWQSMGLCCALFSIAHGLVWWYCSLCCVSPRGGGSSWRRETVIDHGESGYSDAAAVWRTLGQYQGSQL